MAHFPSRTPPLWLQLTLVMLLAWVGIAGLFGRSTWLDWTSPTWTEGDPLEVYARVRIAAEQPGHALLSFTRIERLGAPTGADWSTYPVPDRLVFVLTGLLSRVTGLIAAVHLMGALITGLNAASFFLCARWLRWRWEWAAMLALVFAFCSYNIRWGITLSLSQVFVLPPLVLLCARAARNGPAADRARGWTLLAGGLGLWLGQANPYLTYFAGVVAGGALVLALVRRSPAARRTPLLVFLACLVVCLVLANAGYIVRHWEGATGEALLRGAGDFQTYALRPADWVVPPADHRLLALAALGRGYFAAQRASGEFFYNYLGLLGLAGLAGLLVQNAWRLVRRRWTRADPLLGLGWITAFAVAGGLNTWLGVAGLEVFRAGSRIGVYALVWALFFLGGWISRRTRGLPRTASIGLALLLGIVAVWEQSPSLSDRAARTHNHDRWQAMTRIVASIEAELPAGAKVFQLPAVPFPEAGPVGSMPDYQHMLPLLVSHSLHFSYGHLRPSLWSRWARYVGRLPAPEMLRALERTGFSVLWLDRQAYADAGESIAAQLRSAGATELSLPPESPRIRIFRLNPDRAPQMPDLHNPRLSDPWDPAETSPRLLAMDGWYPLENQAANRWRWAARQAVLGCWRDGTPVTGTIRFQLGGRPGSTVIVSHNGRELWRGQPGPSVHEFQAPLAPGLNTLTWELGGRTFRPGGNDPRELGFMVENLSLSVP